MNPYIDLNRLSHIEKPQEGARIQEIDGIQWDYTDIPPRKIKKKFIISYENQNEIKYIQDGSIIRIDYIKDQQIKQEVLTNLEQIQYLFWFGEYGKNNEKIDKWIATWKGQTLVDVGGYYSDKGLKQGLWKELIKNYWSKAQVYEIGKYKNNLRKGTWKYIYMDQEIGGGKYNQQGQRNGKWIELNDQFSQYSQITHIGLYQNGKKVGKWDIYYRKDVDQPFELIGGGLYDESGSIKIGKWNELSIGYDNFSQVIYRGEYQDGKKVAKWDILFRKDEQETYEKLGGGLYDDEGHNKIGYWTELSDEFNQGSQIVFYGEYQNGKKINKWITKQEGEEIGGGSYDEGGSIKVGKWIELREEYGKWSQVIYQGEYRNNKKVGKWEILYMMNGNEQLEQIGGGLYDELGSYKVGYWTELSDEFKYDSQIVQYGEYQNGKKVNKWITSFEGDYLQPYLINNKYFSGGGSYNQAGSIKVGKWIELKDGFDRWSQAIYYGEYENGNKIGIWDVFFWNLLKQQFELIGSGSYDKGCQIKIGRWNELSERFRDNSQVTYNGCYNRGKKIGRWDILYEGINYGGGQYNEDSLKIGRWIELSEGFSNSSQITYNGEYKKGKKVGKWDIYYKKTYGAYNYEQIGGGLYDEEGTIKIGRWIEECDSFNEYYQVIYNGEYKNSRKVGRWDIFYRKPGQQQFEKIGGGLYHQEDSLKTGLWIELSNSFSKELQYIYHDELKQGKQESQQVEMDLPSNKISEQIQQDN
ncbi:unnamed protein product [Paramecium pentaurelia]|uniref:Uncharacterized protein n=1 Tax=Paramecium pentaurelia TaxID=43138 RepID=A0A8S1YLE0_9CILI|nr:unnamed protein product [Paramecium pentaurelia]